MARYEERQTLRALGWRGSKARRVRKDAGQIVRPDLAAYVEPEPEEG